MHVRMYGDTCMYYTYVSKCINAKSKVKAAIRNKTIVCFCGDVLSFSFFFERERERVCMRIIYIYVCIYISYLF